MEGKVRCTPTESHVDEVVKTPAFSPLHEDAWEASGYFSIISNVWYILQRGDPGSERGELRRFQPSVVICDNVRMLQLLQQADLDGV